MVIAAGALLARKRRALQLANIFFGGVVLWNLFVIALLAMK
jgi:hypothetical protein